MSTMGSSTFWGKITVLIAVCGWGLSAQAKYDGGSGTEAEPFRISAVSDWQELMATPADWGGHFILTSDIDLNGVSITPIAPDTSTSSGFQGTQFTGVFDGNEHIIRNAVINMPSKDYVGLFGYLGQDGQIKNLGVEDVIIRGIWYVGSLVGYNYSGTISDCYSTGSVSGSSYVGGLVGFNMLCPITNCYSSGSVSGMSSVGGLVGHNSFGTIINSYSMGSVTGNSCIGGLVGRNAENTRIINCYSTGSVSGIAAVGGLVGENYEGILTTCYATGPVSGHETVGGLVGANSHTGSLTDCYATGSVSGDGHVGGLVGGNYEGILTDCYATGSVSGYSHSGGLVGNNYEGTFTACFWDKQTSGWTTSAGGTPKTTAEMKTQSTFTSAAWDFIEVWDIGENQTYPFLRTYLAGDINHDGVVDFRDITYLAADWLSGL